MLQIPCVITFLGRTCSDLPGAGLSGGVGAPHQLLAVVLVPSLPESSAPFSEKQLESLQQQMWPSPKGKKYLAYINSVWVVNNAQSTKRHGAIH